MNDPGSAPDLLGDKPNQLIKRVSLRAGGIYSDIVIVMSSPNGYLGHIFRKDWLKSIVT